MASPETYTLDAPARRRRRLVFVGIELAILLVLLAVLAYTQPGIWIQYVGTPEQKALLLIEELDGYVRYRDADPNGPVVYAEVGRKIPLSGSDLPKFLGFPELETLSLCLSDFTGDDFTALAGLNHLEVLHLWRCRLADRSLASLRVIPHLHELSLAVTKVNDEQLRWLGALPELEFLDLSFTDVKGPGLRHLHDLGKLRVLSLRGCWLGDGLGALNDVPTLRELSLTRAELDATALKQLKTLRNLRKVLFSEKPPHVERWFRKELQELPDLELVFVKNPE